MNFNQENVASKEHIRNKKIKKVCAYSHTAYTEKNSEIYVDFVKFSLKYSVKFPL